MKNILNKFSTCCKTFFAILVIATNTGIYADDTEVFYSVNVAKPNLLFVLDVSGSMNSILTGAATGEPGTTVDSISSGGDSTWQRRGSNTRIFNSQVIDISTNTYPRFRFTNIDVPQGAEIVSAHIQFTSAERDTGFSRFKTYIENSGNARQNQSIYFANLSGGPDWELTNTWSRGESGDDQKTPDFKDMVQTVVSRTDWQANNAMSFYLGAEARNRQVAGFGHRRLAPAELTIEYVADGVTRIKVMRDTLRAVLESAPDNVKVGLMNYGELQIHDEVRGAYSEEHRHHSVSGIAYPVTDINAKSREVVATNDDVHGLPSYPTETMINREFIADIADSWEPSGFTPIVDALYEAALYFRGEKAHYGQQIPTRGGAHPSTYEGAVIKNDITNTEGKGRDNATAPNYISPIESSCQENYIVLMTDGEPTYRYRANDGNWLRGSGPLARIRGRANGPQGRLANAIPNCATAAGVGVQGNCTAELTHYIANNDNLPNPTSVFPHGQEGDQLIKTFAIGFGTGTGTHTEKYLKSIVTYDDENENTKDDGYYLAASPEELAASFAKILEEVSAPKGTLASPGYSVNVKNGLEHERDIFIPVFDRKNTSRWSGNLKKFKLVDINGRRTIQGKNDKNATDELGNFTSDAIDYWSTSNNDDPDGRAVQKGGVANLLDPAKRNIYSNLTGKKNVDLASGDLNKLDVSNIANISNEALGLSKNATQKYKAKLINFMRGWKNGVTDSSANPPPEKRYHMGDMLHSEPLVVTYNAGTGSSQTGKVQYIFAGTNEGYLHAFDANTGEEKFAFIPAELLSTISEPQFLNAGTQKDHLYGIDGAITGDFIGASDGKISADDGDRAIIYFGLRRGGTSYYALDVTNFNAPKLLWTKSQADHLTMGQSWSTPYVANVGDTNGKAQEVIMVSAGYDEDEDRDKTDGSGEVDDSRVEITADVGNDIFIFNAKNGNKVWSMPSEMRDQITSSIAGGIKPLDTNNNGLVDRIYFGDTGGNVWRVDLSENIGDSDKPSRLTKLASLGEKGTTNNRMFFNEPDVALMRLNGRSVYAVSIGSGFRAHPMDTRITDKFYMLIDDSPFSVLEDSDEYKTITESTLATISVSKDGSVKQTNSIKDVDKRGWLVNLPEKGEKVLGDATAINGSIVFTTLVPEVLASGAGIDQCAAPVTYSRLYAIDILTGTAKWDFDGDGTPEAFTDPLTPEIISSVDKVFITPEPLKPLTDPDTGELTGETECQAMVDLRVGKKSTQVSAYNSCRLDNVYWSDPVETN